MLKIARYLILQNRSKCVGLDNPDVNFGQEYRSIKRATDGNYTLLLTPPSWVSSSHVISIGILVKPYADKRTRIIAKALLFAKNNSQLEMSGERDLPANGGLLQLSGVNGSKILGVNSIKINFNAPVDVRYTIDSFPEHPTILWMGKK